MASNQAADSNLTNPDPADAVALPTWEEARKAVSVKERVRSICNLLTKHGGKFHGPRIETLSMEEGAFWRFMAEVEAEIRSAERERDRWMPIESAPKPKVGERRQQVLLISQYPSSSIWTDTVHGWWDAFDNNWARWKHQWLPTHWMYVPAPPRSLATPSPADATKEQSA